MASKPTGVEDQMVAIILKRIMLSPTMDDKEKHAIKTLFIATFPQLLLERGGILIMYDNHGRIQGGHSQQR